MIHIIRRPMLAMLLTLSVTANLNAAETTGCKGLDQAQCGGNNACSWVDAYKRSDGREVNGYCRAKPAKKTSQNPTKFSSSKKTS